MRTAGPLQDLGAYRATRKGGLCEGEACVSRPAMPHHRQLSTPRQVPQSLVGGCRKVFGSGMMRAPLSPNYVLTLASLFKPNSSSAFYRGNRRSRTQGVAHPPRPAVSLWVQLVCSDTPTSAYRAMLQIGCLLLTCLNPSLEANAVL